MLHREVTSPRSWLPAIALGLASCWLAVLFAAGMMFMLSGCLEMKRIGGEVGGTVAEWIACPTELVDCGMVFMCEQAADNPLGHVEICIDVDDHPEWLADAEALYGDCEPTPRHQGLCVSTCSEPSPLPDGKGANAYNGVFCP
jgi:hypothetical protein